MGAGFDTADRGTAKPSLPVTTSCRSYRPVEAPIIPGVEHCPRVQRVRRTSGPQREPVGLVRPGARLALAAPPARRPVRQHARPAARPSGSTPVRRGRLRALHPRQRMGQKHCAVSQRSGGSAFSALVAVSTATDVPATVLSPAGGKRDSPSCRSGHSPRVERFAPTAAGRYRKVGSGQVGRRHDCYQGSECRTVRWLRQRAVFMRPSPDGAGAIMSLCARRAGVLAGRACCRTGLLAGGAARAWPRAGCTEPFGHRAVDRASYGRVGGFRVVRWEWPSTEIVSRVRSRMETDAKRSWMYRRHGCSAARRCGTSFRFDGVAVDPWAGLPGGIRD
ncbi:MAG: hypothetical protein ACJAQ3_003123 [Planctomycetota bacterium]